MKKSLQFIIKCVFLIYIACLIYILFLSSMRQARLPHLSTLADRLRLSVNLIPFKTIEGYITALRLGNINSSIVYQNIFGNLVLFLPMGILLPAIFGKFRKAYITLPLILLTIACAEFLQLIFGLGSLDIDDLILNFAGAVVGYLVFSAVYNLIYKNRA